MGGGYQSGLSCAGNPWRCGKCRLSTWGVCFLTCQEGRERYPGLNWRLDHSESFVLRLLLMSQGDCPTSWLISAFRAGRGGKAKGYRCKLAECSLHQRTFFCVSASDFCLCFIGCKGVTWSVVAREAGKWSFLAGHIVAMNGFGILLVRKKGKIGNW